MAHTFDWALPSPSPWTANRVAQGPGSRAATDQPLPFPAGAEQAAKGPGCAPRVDCRRRACEERLTRWARTAMGRIAATIFFRHPCHSHIRATMISSPGRSATSEPGHRGKLGFQRSVEASLQRTDAVASLLAPVRSADGRNRDLSRPSVPLAIHARLRPNSSGTPSGFALDLRSHRRISVKV
jgi:hypothetical protein